MSSAANASLLPHAEEQKLFPYCILVLKIKHRYNQYIFFLMLAEGGFYEYFY